MTKKKQNNLKKQSPTNQHKNTNATEKEPLSINPNGGGLLFNSEQELKAIKLQRRYYSIDSHSFVQYYMGFGKKYRKCDSRRKRFGQCFYPCLRI
jgi:hypothetical protein